MAFLEIRVPIVVSAILIVLGLPASGVFLLFGVDSLLHPESGADVLPSLVLCGLDVFLLLMAVAAYRGILHRKRKSQAD